MNQIIKRIDNKTVDYFIIKEKVGHKYHDIMKYKNNIFNRLFLYFKKFYSNRELYIVPEFKGVEGCYYRIK